MQKFGKRGGSMFRETSSLLPFASRPGIFNLGGMV
jgi:hypothetical protein